MAIDLDVRTLSTVLGSLYEAAADPSRWGEALGILTRVTDAESAIIHTALAGNFLNNRFELQYNIDPQAQREYNEYYHRTNLMGPRIEHVVRSQGFWAGNSEDVCSLEEFKRTEYGNDWAGNYGLVWGSTVAVSTGNGMVALSLCRPEKRGSLGTRGRDLVHLLAPHFTRVLHLHRSLTLARTKAEVGRVSTDHFDTAVFAVDAESRVVSTNAVAEGFLRTGLIELRDKKLHIKQDPKSARALEALIARAAETGAGRGVHPGGALRFQNGLGHLIFQVVPFRSESVLVVEQPCAIVFVTSPDLRPRSRADLLVSLFGLSPAEARVAHLVASGYDLREIAEETHTSVHTVRTQLKSVFRKTGTSKQSQLVRLVLSLPSR